MKMIFFAAIVFKSILYLGLLSRRVLSLKMQICKFHHDGINAGGQRENFVSWELQQGGNIRSSDTKAATPSSYAANLYDKLNLNYTIDHSARTQKTGPSRKQSDPVGSIQEIYSPMLTPSSIQQPLPAAPQRLRIRRQSMRQETVDLLAVLDDLLRRPGCHQRKS